MTTVIVKNSRFISYSPVSIPKGTVEAERVLVQLDKSWDGLTVRIHWANKASGAEVVSLLERDKTNSIPWEVLSDPGELRMGLVGLDGETRVKPTIWLCYGYVVEGVDPASGADPKPPTPSWEQQMVGQAEAAAASAKAAQEAAEMAGPYAQAAKASAESAKDSEVYAAASAQAAGQSQASAAQAQVSAQGNATAAQQAQAAAQQAAQEAQIAKESVAQSAQAAATDAKRAETASQEAQDAAVRAEAVDAYHRKEANDRFALALKNETGKGKSHEIYPDEGSNLVVTAYGFTEQEGEGNPSPENVRPITVLGDKYVEVLVDGSGEWFTYGNSGAYMLLPVKAKRNYDIVYTDSQDLHLVYDLTDGKYGFNITGSNNWLAFNLNAIGVSGVDNIKNWVALHPFKIWYKPKIEAEATGRYAKALTNHTTLQGGLLPLAEPLCDGDNVVSVQDGQCVEVHNMLLYQMTGEEKGFTGSPESLMFLPGAGSQNDYFSSTYIDIQCSHALGKRESVNADDSLTVAMASGFIRFSKGFKDRFGSREGLAQYMKEQYDAGTPITILFNRNDTKAKAKTYTHAAVPLIARPDSNGKVTVSGERDVSAVYNKSIKKAFEEINAAILKLGGTQNV